MKSFLPALLIFFVLNVFSQVAPPQAFSYSAVARNSQGNPLVNQSVGLQFTILKGSTVGNIVYQENQFTTTNQFGMFELMIGTGTVQQGNFNNINWGNDSYYLKVGLDATGGTNFQVMGNTQFLSVPYALYAGNAGNSSSVSDHDTSATNELQTLSVNGDTLKISQGNQVVLPKGSDGDTSSTNEIQNLSLSGDTLKISGGNKLVMPYNSQMGFTVKINGVSISDPSINDVMIGPYSFLTENNYRYDFDYDSNSPLNDTLYLTYPFSGISNFAYTNSGCTGQEYVLAGTSGGISPGRIWGYGAASYVPFNATPVLVTYVDGPGGCQQITGPAYGYIPLPNNPAVTGFNISLPAEVKFVRK